MTMKTFDAAAVARPYPFVGTVARGDSDTLAISIDTMVADAGNVTDEEAKTIWGLGAAHVKKIDSRSATDISELAFRAHRGSVHALKRAVTAEIGARWDSMADSADAAGMLAALAKIEQACADVEVRREMLRHAAFLEGQKADEAGQVRRACAIRGSCLTHPAAAAYLASGLGNLADVAAEVAKPPQRRKRGPTSPASSGTDLKAACAALLMSGLRMVGLQANDGAEEKALLDNPPDTLPLIIAAVEAHVEARVANDPSYDE
jgi:hypothetical protein